MTSKAYWSMRSAQDMVDRMGAAEQTAAEMNKAIRQSADYIAKEVKAVFRGIESFGISEAEARKILNAAGNKTAIQSLRAAAQRVSDPEKRQALMSAIDSAGAYRYRITRLEQLNKDINAECRKLYKTENRAVTSALKTVANDSYYHSIFNIQQETGLGFSFAKFSQKDVDRILRANWNGGNYSQRIWRDVSATAESMKKELLVSMLSGRSNEKTARIIQDRFGVNAYCARRIVRTESAYVANAAQMSAYDEAGVEKYRFIATLDSKTSEVCAALDGKVFAAKDAVPGTNYPPMHPFCRSTTIAEFGGDALAGMERRARDKDGNTVKVPADMTYEEWYRRFVENGVDKSGESDIIVSGSDGKLEQAKTRDKKIEITDIAVSKAEAPDIPCFTPEQNAKFKELHKDLLKRAKEENDSNEVAYLFDPRTLTHQMEFGTISSVNVFDNPMARDMLRNGEEKGLFLIHNHPSTKSFSYSDIGVLLMNDNLGGMTAIANNGVVSAVYKTSKYDPELALSIMKDIRSKYPKTLSGEDDIAIVKQFLKVSRSCGIEVL
ncbi:MAG: minor capsid protein [Oscillospiraceae bacterium]